MSLFGATLARPSGSWRTLALAAASVLLAASLIACNGGGQGAASDERVLELEAKVHSMEESLEALGEENATLQRELIDLRQRQAASFQEQEAAKIAGRIEREAAADFKEGQEQQLAALEEGQARDDERFDDLDSRLQELETVASRVGQVLPTLEKWFTGMDRRVKQLEGTDLERTAGLAEAAGGEVYYIDSRQPEERAILVMPLEPIDGNPLIVSLHGYGGNSADHSLYIPLHEQVNSRGFGLLLPNGTLDSEGNPHWNPTLNSKSSADDFTYLADLVARARELKDFGPVYFFGHSNGGFMSYWMACRGLPGLRAVASLAGTSYVDDSSCEGAPPVSVLQIHGMDDRVIRFHGSEESKLPALTPNESYAGAKDMYWRWGQRAGCAPNSDRDIEERLDLDADIEGPETFIRRFTKGCAEGITVEIWSSDEGGHTPAYGDALVDTLLDWLLAQE